VECLVALGRGDKRRRKLAEATGRDVGFSRNEDPILSGLKDAGDKAGMQGMT